MSCLSSLAADLARLLHRGSGLLPSTVLSLYHFRPVKATALRQFLHSVKTFMLNNSPLNSRVDEHTNLIRFENRPLYPAI